MSIPPSQFDRSLLPAVEPFFRNNLEKFKRRGRKAAGLCPFHKGSGSLSFSIDVERGLWFCFGCQVGGDLIDFVKIRDKCGFREAAETLGALRPLHGAEAETWQRAREAKAKAEQGKQSAWIQRVEGLLSDMETYEGVRDWAFAHRNDDLHGLAQQGIVLTGQRYLLAKLGAEHGAR